MASALWKLHLFGIDAIDWKAKTLRVEQSKNRSILDLPLSDEALQVLRDYLADNRPASPRRHLFLCAKAQCVGLTNHAIARIYKVHAQRSGLPCMAVPFILCDIHLQCA